MRKIKDETAEHGHPLRCGGNIVLRRWIGRQERIAPGVVNATAIASMPDCLSSPKASSMDIALITCAALPDLAEDDRSLVAAFAERGLDARPAIWNDPAQDWRRARVSLIRSAWDSHLHPDAFRAWAEAADAQALLLNPARLVAWNLHKGYLRELAERGVPVTPTRWFARGEVPDLARVLRETGWRKAVVKPAVSAGADDTHIVDGGDAAAMQREAEALAAEKDLMIQPYLEAFETEGERSYVYIGGRLSHAVQRPPTLASALRSFASARAIPMPDPGEIALADAAIAALPEGWLYARVDAATNNDGISRIQEIELIEPALFLGLAPGAAQRLADAAIRRMDIRR